MDNDFKRPTARAFGQPLRPMQPMKPMQPRHTQPMARPINLALSPEHTNTRPVQEPATPQAIAQHAQAPNYSAHNQSSFNPTPTHAQSPQSAQQPSPTNFGKDTTDNQFTPPSSKKPRRLKRYFKWVLISSIVLVLCFGAWSYHASTQQELKKQTTQIATLISQLNSAQKSNQDLAQQIANTPGATVGLTQAEQNSVTAAVTSGNYAAIKKFLINDSLVIIAASEGVGRRTPEQVVSDLKYLDSASQPWNFSLPQETLDNYRDGDYAQYFPEGAIIGKSADNKIVSFSTTPSGKISVVFLASDESLL